LQVLYRLVTLFNISIDQYLLLERAITKSTRRRQIEALLDSLEEKDLIVVEGTVKGLCKAKEAEE